MLNSKLIYLQKPSYWVENASGKPQPTSFFRTSESVGFVSSKRWLCLLQTLNWPIFKASCTPPDVSQNYYQITTVSNLPKYVFKCPI